MKIAAGEIITVNGSDAKITKIRRMPQMIKRGGRFTPTMRVYYRQGKKQGHCDCEVPADVEVIFGTNAGVEPRRDSDVGYGPLLGQSGGSDE